MGNFRFKIGNSFIGIYKRNQEEEESIDRIRKQLSIARDKGFKELMMKIRSCQRRNADAAPNHYYKMIYERENHKIGNILFKADKYNVDDGSGISYVVLEKDGSYGITSFEWNAHRHKDRLYSCKSVADYEEIYNLASNRVMWSSDKPSFMEELSLIKEEGTKYYPPKDINNIIFAMKNNIFTGAEA